MALSEQARAKRNEYCREYFRKNRDRWNSYQRAWRENNPEKRKKYYETYWTKKAQAERGDTDGKP